MDTSETYIKMCDCSEIQKKWDSLDCYGDWVAFLDAKHNNGTIPVHSIWHSPAWGLQTFNDFRPTIQECTWLPRQDQIQEMMKGNMSNFYLLESFYEFIEDLVDKNPIDYADKSMERLWLAFYMWEKHQKKWLPKEQKWVKI